MHTKHVEYLQQPEDFTWYANPEHSLLSYSQLQVYLLSHEERLSTGDVQSREEKAAGGP